MGLGRIILLLLLLSFPNAMGQTDSTYTQQFPNKVTVRTNLSSLSNTYKVTSLEDDITLLLEPNTRDRIGVSLQFRAIELAFGFTPNILYRKSEIENSRLLYFNSRLFLGKWMQSLELYHQRGYFAEILGVELTYPDFRTTKVGGSTAYIFNDHFSFRAVTSQNEWQKRSAGSFIPRVYYYYTDYDFEFGDSGSKFHSYDFALGPGYHYNWVLGKHLLFSVGAAAAIGFNITADKDESISSELYEASFRSGIGYNSEHFFAGLDSNFIVLEHNERREARVDDRITFFEFYVGYRFDAPKKLLKLAEKVNKKLPF